MEPDPGHVASHSQDSGSNDFRAVGPALSCSSTLKDYHRPSEPSSAHLRTDTLQETHIDADKSSLLTLTEYDLISYRLHDKHGRATYEKSSLMDVSGAFSTAHCDVIKVGSYSIANVYKPPSESWDTSAPLPVLAHPTIYIGNFNSHHPDWGYDSEDVNDARLTEWASLVHNSKQHRTFTSAQWQRDFSPDLCWLSAVNSRLLSANCILLDDFCQSQHRPTIDHTGLTIPIIHSTGKRRWNFRKADWPNFLDHIEKTIPHIPRNRLTAYRSRTPAGVSPVHYPRHLLLPCQAESALYTHPVWMNKQKSNWRNMTNRVIQT